MGGGGGAALLPDTRGFDVITLCVHLYLRMGGPEGHHVEQDGRVFTPKYNGGSRTLCRGCCRCRLG